ncbi:putative H+-transporting two-sector ATPase chain b precursor, mitochondrial [Ceraceosorus guamensis]|uniref:ATP synthase subunit 4 n=1 Tax=Ceraceosorus guamensis TaxID=1522189 RepID=A0A316VYK6_9BASI|nr:putative H+-transporting two-sector ATPase chain b precursor, mitochondrial [Ceraceosorus guamensis]PWN42747.1 putative H+-transporting two-sector ATPase chain b precursor, mitochondrial [Ceraceosorus guamensis]
MSLRAALPRAGALRTAARPSAAMAQAVTIPSASRGYADKPAPEKRATALLDLLPGNSIVSKTGWVTAGTGIGALAISNELYVANDETVILAGFVIFATLIGRTLSGPYQEWAQGQVDVSIMDGNGVELDQSGPIAVIRAYFAIHWGRRKFTNILNGARAEHTKAVQSRIDNVSQQQDVVNITKSLFTLAKETAQTEQAAFELRQKTELAAEVKSVLDSWVRYEAQEREAEQKQLARSVIEKVTASLRDEKLQKSILDDAVSEIERLVKSKAI